MEKVERPMMEPLGDVQLKEAKAGAINWIQQLQMKSEDIFIKKVSL